MEQTKRRNAGIAFLLSILVTGLGQLYSGKPARGALTFVGFWGLLIVLGLSSLPESLYGLVALIVMTNLGLLAVAADAALCSMKNREISLQWYNKWYIYVALILTVSLAGWLAFVPLIQHKMIGLRSFKMPSVSMTPALVPGDHFLVRLQSYERRNPARGEVIVFIYPEDRSKTFVQRVVGLGGEKVDIRNKKVFIDDRPLDEPYAVHWSKDTIPPGTSPRDDCGPIQVPEGAVFVMGDNRDYCHDSRYWGCVDLPEIQGKALFIYWSPDRKRVGRQID